MKWGSDRLLVVAAAVMLASTAYWFPPTGSAQASAPTIVGEWTLNVELSDRVPAGLDEGDARGDRRRGDRGRGGFGGFGGGAFDEPRGRGGDRFDADQARRRLDELQSVLDAPDRLTIVSTPSLVIITTGDGRTTRLAPDGSKIEDESTNAERRTRWDGAALVSEISGLGEGTVIETYSVDADGRRLTVTVQLPEGVGRRDATRVVHHVYDAQKP